jgi:hypothetical protein
MGNFNFKNTYFFDSARLNIKGKMGVVSHICIYKINNRSKNLTFLNPSCLSSLSLGTDT